MAHRADADLFIWASCRFSRWSRSEVARVCTRLAVFHHRCSDAVPMPHQAGAQELRSDPCSGLGGQFPSWTPSLIGGKNNPPGRYFKVPPTDGTVKGAPGAASPSGAGCDIGISAIELCVRTRLRVALPFRYLAGIRCSRFTGIFTRLRSPYATRLSRLHTHSRLKRTNKSWFMTIHV